MPLYGHELNETINPIQAGLGWAVKLDKGEFIGREAASQAAADDATKPRARRAGAGGQADRPRGVPRVTADGNAGRHRDQRHASARRSTSRWRWATCDRSSRAVGTRLAVDVRGNAEPATVVPLPFYKRKPSRRTPSDGRTARSPSCPYPAQES